MIQQKLLILLENAVIDQETYDAMQKVLVFLVNQNIVSKEDEADTFVTHLAMATMRQRRGEEQIDGVDEAVKAEIEAAPEYDEAVKIWNEVLSYTNETFPKNEDDYFYLHLVTLLQSK